MLNKVFMETIVFGKLGVERSQEMSALSKCNDSALIVFVQFEFRRRFGVSGHGDKGAGNACDDLNRQSGRSRRDVQNDL